MNKAQIQKLAKFIIEDVEKDKDISIWVEGLVRELEKNPKNLLKKINDLERKVDRLERDKN